MISKCSLKRSTSPRTSTRGGTVPESRCGTPRFAPAPPAPTTRRLAVTSSPLTPSPRVEPERSLPPS